MAVCFPCVHSENPITSTIVCCIDLAVYIDNLVSESNWFYDKLPE